MCSALYAEEVALSIHDEIARLSVADDVQPAHDGGRDARELAHHELRRGGDLIGYGDYRGVEDMPRRIGLAAEIDERRDPRAAKRDVDDAVPERSAEGVADHHPDLPAGAPLKTRADARGGRVRIDGQEHERPMLRCVRCINACRGADEAVPGLGDHEWWPGPDDRGRLGEDHLEAPGVASGRELARAFRRLDVVEPNDTALRFRDGFLGDDEDVEVLQWHALGDQRRQVVSLDDRGKPFDGQHADLRHRRGPSRRERAGPLRRASACR